MHLFFLFADFINQTSYFDIVRGVAHLFCRLVRTMPTATKRKLSAVSGSARKSDTSKGSAPGSRRKKRAKHNVKFIIVPQTSPASPARSPHRHSSEHTDASTDDDFMTPPPMKKSTRTAWLHPPVYRCGHTAEPREESPTIATMTADERLALSVTLPHGYFLGSNRRCKPGLYF